MIKATLFIFMFLLSVKGQNFAQFKELFSDEIRSEDLVLSKESPESGQRYVSAGNRSYITGMQNGNFPPMGWHIKDEMGGIWIPPLKAADGIWLRINGKFAASANKYVRKAAWSEFYFQSEELNIIRRDIALDNQSGALLIYTIKNNSAENKVLDIELIIRFHPILSFPFVQGDEDYAKNKEAFAFRTIVKYDSSLSGVTVTADRYKRFIFCKTNIQPEGFSLQKQNLPIDESSSYFRDTEADALMKYNITAKAGEEINIMCVITGSLNSGQEAYKTAAEILSNAENLLIEKENKYVDIANRTNIVTPDETINKAFLWNKLNMAMQVLTVPGLGTAAVAGYPDYPWFFGNDGSFSVPAFLSIGQPKNAKDHLRLVASSSNRVNESSGKIVHEIVTDGSVFWGRNTDPGNTNETCQFAKATGQIWKWTGDDKFLSEMYPTVKKGMLVWLINSQIVEGDIFPGGFGNDEVLGWGAKRLDVQCYAVEGFLALAEMAEYFGDGETVKKSKEWAEKIKEGINRIWWMEDKGRYANSLTKENKPVLLGSISPVPLESKIADNDKANVLLDSIEASNNNNDYGWGDMSIGAGIAAAGTSNYGSIEQSLKYIKGIANLWDVEMPGGLPEHNPPYKINPAHTQWRTNPVQLWGGYGLHFPLIRNILGVEPDVPNKTIRVIPNLPKTWDKIECSNLVIADDTLNIYVTRSKNRILLHVNNSGDFKLEAGAILPAETKINKVEINNKEQGQSRLLTKNTLAGKEIYVITDEKQVILEIEIE